jgi:Domain of unknown function (DUF1707)
VATGPWDPTRAGTPDDRILASDADRERAVFVLKTAFVRGVLTKDELTVRTGHALQARTYGQLAAVTVDLAAQLTKPARIAAVPARRRLNKKVVAWGTCAIVVPSALAAAFLNYYGGFLVIMLFTFLGSVALSKPPAPPRPMGSRR